MPFIRIRFNASDTVARAELALALGGIADPDLKRMLIIIANNARVNQERSLHWACSRLLCGDVEGRI